MRGIHNNLSNLQINQIAMEQAALQAAKNQQASRVRAESAEEILKQQEKAEAAQKKNSTTSKNNPDGQKKSDSENFKNLLYSKEGALKTNSDKIPPEVPASPQITHIDFKV